MSKILVEDAERVVAALTSEFRASQGCKILLTGCTGFVGKGLLQSLIRALEIKKLDCRICLPVRGGEKRLQGLIPDALHDRIEIVDWAASRLVDQVSSPCDFVIHAASPVDISRYRHQPALMMREMVGMTEEVLELLAEASPLKLLFLSSGAIYGDFYATSPGPVEESCLSAPALEDWRSCYGEAKRYCELLIASQGYPSVSARLFSVIGPCLDLDAPFASAAFIKQAGIGQHIKLNTDGSAVRSFCYQSDLTITLLKLLFEPDATGGFNVGSREQTCIRELAVMVAGHFPGVKVMQGEQIDSQRNFYVPCLDRVSKYYVPQLSLEQGLSRTITSLREQGRLSNR